MDGEHMSMELGCSESKTIFDYLSSEHSQRDWEKNSSPESLPGVTSLAVYSEETVIASSILDYRGSFLFMCVLGHPVIADMKEGSKVQFTEFLNLECGCPNARFEPKWTFDEKCLQVQTVVPFNDDILMCVPDEVMALFFNEDVIGPMEAVMCSLMALANRSPEILSPELNLDEVRSFLVNDKFLTPAKGCA